MTSGHLPPCLSGTSAATFSPPHTPGCRSLWAPRGWHVGEAQETFAGRACVWQPALRSTVGAMVRKESGRPGPHHEGRFLNLPGGEDARKSNEGFKTTGVTLFGAALSLTQFFFCTMRGLDRRVSRDYGEGSRVWVLGLDVPGMEQCCWPAV